MKRSSRATTRSKRASRKASTCWSRKCARSASTSSSTRSSTRTRNSRPPSPPNNTRINPTPPQREGSGAKNERTDELREPDRQARDLRRDPHRHRVARQDPQLVVRRNQEAGNDQLPHVQAGA